jgi:hypothetical protein
MSKKEKKKKEEPLDEFHYHEALDRSYIVAELIETALIDHPVIQRHGHLKTKIENAQSLIIEVYQEIGSLSITLFDPDYKKDVVSSPESAENK